MPAGRPKKAVSLKILQGTLRPCRELPAAAAVTLETPPKPPKSLKKDGKILWKSIAGELTSAGVLSSLDLPALTMFCMIWDTVRTLESGGQPVPAAYYSQFKSLASEFGMTPASRRRFTPGVKTPANAFQNNGRKP